jgi:hypothetical protein
MAPEIKQTIIALFILMVILIILTLANLYLSLAWGLTLFFIFLLSSAAWGIYVFWKYID